MRSNLIIPDLTHQRILFLFKDPPAHRQALIPPGRSWTIEQHLSVARRIPSHSTATSETSNSAGAQFTFLHPPLTPNMSVQRPQSGLLADQFVWGWFRKQWERHDALFAGIAASCQRSSYPKALLYNPHLNLIYNATIHDIHFRPGLTTVTVPDHWRQWCPKYYRELPETCGAFFVMRLPSEEPDVATKQLARLHIDFTTFECLGQSYPRDIQPPPYIERILPHYVDLPATKPNIRTCQHTILILNEEPQSQKAPKELASLSKHHHASASESADSRIALRFQRSTLRNILPSLKAMSPNEWKTLASMPKTIETLGSLARKARSRTTRLDFALVAAAHSNPALTSVLDDHDADTMSLSKALRDWALTESESEARLAAKDVFLAAWRAANIRYGLAPIDPYILMLPAIETIISTVKYEFGRKFYRDHLSHNIRAALLAANLHRLIREKDHTLPQSGDIVCFFAGLLHDLSLPIVSFPGLTIGFANALCKAPLTTKITAVNSLWDEERFQSYLFYASVLGALPPGPAETSRVPFQHWNDPSRAFQQADPVILHELLLCAQSREHAVASAAILFDRAVESRGGSSLEIAKLLQDMLANPENHPSHELHGIIQAVALHDRRAAGEWRGLDQLPIGTPAPLGWSDYLCPLVVAVADECQEWGRPLADLDSMGVTDADVELTPGHIVARFSLSGDTGLFQKVPYRVLEALLSKIGTLRRLGASASATGPSEHVITHLEIGNLNLFQLKHLSQGFEIAFDGRAKYICLPEGEQRIAASPIRSMPDEELYSIKLQGSSKPPQDLLIVKGDHRGNLRTLLGGKAGTLTNLRVEGNVMTMQLSDPPATVTGELARYWFGDIDPRNSTTEVRNAGTVAVAVFLVKGLSLPDPLPLERLIAHRNSIHEHFLDYDWRFTVETSQLLVSLADSFSNGGEIAYLGCPTLALAHVTQYSSSSSKFVLIDRGHPGIDRWAHDGILNASQYNRRNLLLDMPSEFEARFDVVITDPPWYEVEYDAFIRWALRLIRPGGIIGITGYPSDDPQYNQRKAIKLRNIQSALFGDEVSDVKQMGSTDISYTPPAFEVSWDGHIDFTDSDLERYRTTKMDFFEIRRPSAVPTDPFIGLPPEQGFLPRIVGLAEWKDGHYLRVTADDGLFRMYPANVVIETRKGVKRIKPEDHLSQIIAWSTRNTIVRIDARNGMPVEDDISLLAAVYAVEHRSLTAPTSTGDTE